MSSAPSYAIRFKNDDAIEVGLDEAGRGCLYGRLYVGAVVFAKDEEDFFDHGAALKTIRDSKVLTERKRGILFDYINDAALDKAVAFAEATEIDEYNVLQADLRCMHRALDALTVPVDRILVDGDCWKPWRNSDGEEVEAHMVVDGDASYLSIAAAGILAKVSRDRWVAEMCADDAALQERYGLLNNKGYGTAAHMRGLATHGAVGEHRRSFAPVARALGIPVVAKAAGTKVRKGVWAGAD
jgi:ribonuclease HII